MSHIDQALKKWEEGFPEVTPRPTSEAVADRVTERFSLDGYLREGHAVVDLVDLDGSRRDGQVAVDSSDVGQPVLPPRPALADVRPRVAPRGRKDGSANADLEARLVTGSSGAVSIEQYRRLAAVLLDIQIERGLKTLMLTSALPHEGKTLTIVNLALTLSESYNRRVLIIDADLRWPSVHTVLGVANDTGLSEVLVGKRSDLPIHHVSPRLAVLTAGRPGPAPLAGLTSERMGTLIDECAMQFDWVLLDTPPVGLLPDAQLLARLTRAVVLVIAAGATPTATVERAVAELGPECIIGTVLNRVDARGIPEAEYYTRYGAPGTSG